MIEQLAPVLLRRRQPQRPGLLRGGVVVVDRDGHRDRDREEHDDEAGAPRQQAPGGVDLTAAEVKGRSVFALKCSTCHTLSASNAVGRVGPNLDNLRPPKGLVLDAIKNGRARGQGQMPAGLVDGEDAQNVAAYIAATAGHG